MSNRNRIALVLIMFISLALLGFYQNPEGDIFKFVENKIKTNYLRNTTEKVYLHTDKDIYQLGDTLWFKAYTTKVNHERSFESHVLVLGLYNSKNELVFNENFKLNYGTGYGDIIIPTHLDNGNYKLLAYTDYMKNVDSTNVFSKSIQIFENRPKYKLVLKHFNDYYNPGDSLEIKLLSLTNDNQILANIPVSIEVVTLDKSFNKTEVQSSKDGEIKSMIKIPKKINEQIFVKASSNYLNYYVFDMVTIPIKSDSILYRFFPEGGNIISGVKNNIAFESYDSYKNPINIVALLKNQNNEILDTIKTSFTGIGAFEFKPEIKSTYFIEVVKPYKISSLINVPEAVDEGIALKANFQSFGLLSIDINTTEKYRDREIYGVLYAGSTIYWKQKINIRNLDQIIIPTSNIPEGLAQFTLFDDYYTPIAERLVFIPSQKKMKINIKTTNEKYRSKEKVNLEIEVTDNYGKPLSANLSIAAVDESMIIQNNSNNILCYNLFEGELSEKFQYEYLLNEDGINLKYIDLVLLTKGWRRFKWEKIITTDLSESVSIKNKKYISGFAGNLRGKPIKNANIQLFNPSKFLVENTQTDVNGNFFFTTDNYVSVADTSDLLLIGSKKNGDNDIDVLLENTYELDIIKHFPNYSFAGKYSSPLDYENALNIEKNEIFYSDFDTQSEYIDEVQITAKRINKVPEATKRKTHQELILKGEDIAISSSISGMGFIDILSKITTNFRELDGKILFRGYNSLLFENNSGALIVVDGMPRGEYIYVLNDLNPADIESVSITKNPAAAARYQGGHLGGLIEIKTKKNKPSDFKQRVDVYNNRLFIKGLKVTREFYSPIYQNNQEKLTIVDNRNTLYWNPDVRINDSGKMKLSFYSSDQKMKVRIICEGININKMAGHAECFINVY